MCELMPANSANTSPLIIVRYDRTARVPLGDPLQPYLRIDPDL